MLIITLIISIFNCLILQYGSNFYYTQCFVFNSVHINTTVIKKKNNLKKQFEIRGLKFEKLVFLFSRLIVGQIGNRDPRERSTIDGSFRLFFAR